jgi:Tfp pilus assembly protein PilF
VSDAVAALQRGDLSFAEQILRAELRTHPNDVEVLDVLGVVLDKQKKYTESDEIYQRAIKLPQPSPALLNNYGNHLLATGKPTEARGVFLKVLALNPSHVNAHVQLARISFREKICFGGVALPRSASTARPPEYRRKHPAHAGPLYIAS